MREALDVLERLRPEFEGRRRHRLSGMELVHRDDLDRVRAAGITANLQVGKRGKIPRFYSNVDVTVLYTIEKFLSCCSSLATGVSRRSPSSKTS